MSLRFCSLIRDGWPGCGTVRLYNGPVRGPGMPTRVRSHAKINLGLYIGAPRPDGFHSLATVYQTIELHDLVTVTARPDPVTSITLTSDDPRVPTDNRNTAYKMVALALEDFDK